MTLEITLNVVRSSEKPVNDPVHIVDWKECEGQNDGPFWYQFWTDDPSNRSPVPGNKKAFKFPHDTTTGNKIIVKLGEGDKGKEMFDITGVTIFVQRGNPNNPDKADKGTMVESKDVKITEYGTSSVTLENKKTEGRPNKFGYFRVTVCLKEDAPGIPRHGFIICDPYWEDT